MSTWEQRLQEVLGPRGYEHCMRRSIQTIVLYESNRCLAPHFPSMRPFQRKIAYLDMANAFVDLIPGLLPHQKREVMYRTGASRAVLQADTAWKRRKLLNKELQKIGNGVRPLLPGRTHQEACDAYVQQMYETVTGNTGPHPVYWEHNHNNVIMCYRLYYRGGTIDTSFPEPNLPKEIYMAAEKPAPATTVPATVTIPNPTATAVVANLPPEKLDDDDLNEFVGSLTPQDRRQTLKEVREHLELLKEFEGVISSEEIASRKRQLFLALPPAPPPAQQQQQQQLSGGMAEAGASSSVNNNHHHNKRVKTDPNDVAAQVGV